MRKTKSMEVRPEDIWIEIFRPEVGDASPVRVTHGPTGIITCADDGDSTEANRTLALTRLTDAVNRKYEEGGDA